MNSHSSRKLAKLWPHSRYKEYEAMLREAAKRWFGEHGPDIHPKMGYCLERHELWPKNIICEDVAHYISQERHKLAGKENFPLHKYLHHGLSSQAMTFNLIGPLILRKDLALLQPAIEKIGIEWPKGEIEAIFEQGDRSVFNEDNGQPTSIDILLSGSSSNSIFIEVKLVERAFGGCSLFVGGDCEGRNPYPEQLRNCYLYHIGRTYWQRLSEFGFSEASLLKGAICPFANYYQFFREVLFAFAKKGSFILLHDARNPAFLRPMDNGEPQAGLWPFLCESIPEGLRGRVGRLTIQCVVKAIEESGRHQDWIHNFKIKYGFH